MIDDIQVIIPFRPNGNRGELHDFVCAWWTSQGFQVLTWFDNLDEPWRKGQLVNEAVGYCAEGMRTRPEFVIVTDADIVIPGIMETVDAIRAGEGLFSQHAGVYRLTEKASIRLMAEAPYGIPPLRGSNGGLLIDDDLEESWKAQWAGSPPVMLPIDVALEIPMDPRFEGWGGEDHAWGDALTTILGSQAKYRSRLNVIHLWHPPQERTTRAVGSEQSENLRNRYRRASSSRRSMERLIGEFKDG